MRYFVGHQGRQLGPFTDFQIREQLASGILSPDDLVWHEGLPAWQPLSTLFPIIGAATPPPMPGGVHGHGGGSPFISAVTREPPPDAPRLAGRGARLLARLIDGVITIVAIVPGIIWLLAGIHSLDRQYGHGPEAPALSDETAVHLAGAHLLGAFLAIIVPLIALAVVQCVLLSTRGQTLGKRWLNIRIVRVSGAPVGFVHAVLLRAVVMGFINQLVGITGLIDPFFIFREDRRCLHDMIADTTVIET